MKKILVILLIIPIFFISCTNKDKSSSLTSESQIQSNISIVSTNPSSEESSNKSSNNYEPSNQNSNDNSEDSQNSSSSSSKESSSSSKGNTIGGDELQPDWDW